MLRKVIILMGVCLTIVFILLITRTEAMLPQRVHASVDAPVQNTHAEQLNQNDDDEDEDDDEDDEDDEDTDDDEDDEDDEESPFCATDFRCLDMYCIRYVIYEVCY